MTTSLLKTLGPGTLVMVCFMGLPQAGEMTSEQ